MPKDNNYIYGPYLVFSDMSTFCSDVDDAVVAYINDTAQDNLESCNDFKAVEPGEMRMVHLSDLIDAYNQLHGTDL
jgi:hypothetical protein